ncbi:MAG: hypothetical protein EP343_03130 [Deltaproteobacteria bacterium]|nr:MAG: hypothetical protein EP343_03130 [Deltaproteobacteria bacterium]
MPGPILSMVGFAIVLSAISWYFLIIDAEKVPKRVGGFASALVMGSGISLTGLVLSPSAFTGTITGVAALLGSFILWLLTQRRLPDGQLVVGVGDPMPPLIALDPHRKSFDLSKLKGQRVMVKFFRGSW